MLGLSPTWFIRLFLLEAEGCDPTESGNNAQDHVQRGFTEVLKSTSLHVSLSLSLSKKDRCEPPGCRPLTHRAVLSPMQHSSARLESERAPSDRSRLTWHHRTHQTSTEHRAPSSAPISPTGAVLVRLCRGTPIAQELDSPGPHRDPWAHRINLSSWTIGGASSSE